MLSLPCCWCYFDISSPQSTNSYLEAREWLRGLPTLSTDAVSRLLAPQDSCYTLLLQKNFRCSFQHSLAPVHRCVVAEPELLLCGVSCVRARAADYCRLILSFSPRQCWAAAADSNATALPPSMSTSFSVSSSPSSSPNYRPILVRHRHHPCCCDKDISNNPPRSSLKDKDEDKVVVSTMQPCPCRHHMKRSVLCC